MRARLLVILRCCQRIRPILCQALIKNRKSQCFYKIFVVKKALSSFYYLLNNFFALPFDHDWMGIQAATLEDTLLGKAAENHAGNEGIMY